MRADGSRQWAGHIRLSLQASLPGGRQIGTTQRSRGSGGRVNAAFVHGKFTSLSVEIYARCGRKAMRKDYSHTMDSDSLSGYGPTISANGPVRTRMRGGVERDG